MNFDGNQISRKYFSRHLKDSADQSIARKIPFLQHDPGQQLVIAVDTLVAGVHFPTQTSAADIARKSLAVNLSDLAAMGADPLAASLSLSLPGDDENWLMSFRDAFYEMAADYDIRVQCDDIIQAGLRVTVQIYGTVQEDKALRRDGARAGDHIYVTGTLGDAALGLKVLQGDIVMNDEMADALVTRLNCPVPHIKSGQKLRGLASSAIDISDGLVADLLHILDASGVAAEVVLDRLPLSSAYKSVFERAGQWLLALSGGDDYELCFTVPESNVERLESLFRADEISYIGKITSGSGLSVIEPSGDKHQPEDSGYDHFIKTISG
ncbi:MAG: thiamine-phosphate kinase [Gammaproteobacteria bacterium]|nr:MAG: thiamine-phosphate kinase [Gammaproteobacteria bacterium]